MRTWLKRMVAGIVSAGTLMGGGLLMAGTANADEIRMPDIGKTITSLTASAATTYPRELVNGDFEYPSMKSLQHYFTGIDRNRSQWISNGQGGDLAKWSDIPGGLDTTRFGWSSTQTQGAMSEQRANAVELQKATGETTQMGELCASQKGTAIYQDIATTPGTLYRIELDHASRYSIHLDQMQVMVGAPGHERPVEMTRTSSNKYGDKIGEKSTTIATHSTNPFGNQSSKDDFSHYVGYYTIPAGQSVTRFTFRQVSGVNTTSGNLLDNIVFTQAYKLDYDRNSDEATGQTPNDTATVKPAKTSATGGVKNVADTNASLPGHLVNGDFEYLPDGGWKTVDAPSYMTNAYTSVDPNNGQYMRNAKHSDADLASWVDWPGFDQSKFAWKTDQKGGHDQGGLKDRAEAVELQQDSMDGNTYTEMVASEPGRTIYQNLATIPGTLYKIRLKHTSLCKDNVDQMQVVINGTPIEMTRVAANGKAGDKVGEKSKTIGTRVTNENRWHHSDQWETYEGYYVIPDGQTTTRFGFKAVNYLDPTKGNLLDDVTFARAYKLSYDKNSTDATGEVPSNQRGKENTTQPAKTKTNGTVKTVADENVRYGSLANGDFSYPSFSDIQKNEQETHADLRTFLKSDDGTLWYNMSVTDLSKYGKIGQIPGFDSSRFAWSSTENGSRVELQQDRNTKNTYAEIVAQQDNTSIYQNVSTGNGGVLYKIRLKHASRQSSHADRMQVLVGSDTAHATPVEMTRVTSNGHGDKVGGKSTIITTKVSNTDPRDHGAQWETYEGYYQVPEGQKNTVFMFKSLEGFKEDETLPGNNVGNLVDDIEFSRSYKLTYDANSSDASGQVPSDTAANTVKQAKSKTNGSVRLAADDDVAEYAVNGLPDHLVNGDFEYPVKSDMPANDGKFWYISQNDGSYFVPGKRYKLPEGFDKAKFAWHSTQTGDTHYPDLERADDVQVNYKADGTNHYSEISAAQSGATIYQDVATVPGVMYKWSLKHASLDSSHLDKMSVIIGEPGKETAQEATRTTANGHGDKLGKVGTVISTKVSNPEMPDGNKFQEGAHTGQWETYTGTYIATGTVTRFAFHSVEGYNAWNGNLLDDISFSKAYKLTYDKNASDATGQVPSNQRGKENTVEPAESKTTGNVKTVADNTSNLPDHLVNGTFDYRGNEIINENQRVYGDTTYLAMISAKTGVIGNPLHSKLDNWDSGKFGWRSNDATAGVDTVEVQRRNHTPYPTNAGNVWGEIAAAKRGKYIYQDIATTPGVVYKWSLKHASRNADQDDSMQVMIGEPGKTVAQQATRTTSNGSDKTGSVGTTIITHGTAQDGKWETYTGDYLATSTVTRFTFRSVRDSNGQGLDFTAEGNCVDDLSFDKAYKLSYDKNSSDATGSVPSNQYGKENTVQPAKSKTTGSVGLAADKTASGLTVHDLKKNDKGKVPSSSKADSTQPAAFKAPDAKVETIASRSAGDELAVNGGFDTPKWSIAKEGQGLPWVYVKPNAGTIRSYAQAMGGQPGVKAGGLTAATFAWQDLDAIGGNQNFELHREKDGNTAADVHAGRTVAQTVNTTPGASYTFSIRHSGRSKGNAGGVTLLTGPDKDHLTPVKLTRTTVSKTGQKYGDKTGDVGTVAYTHSDSMDATEGSHEPWDHSDDWESYEGTVIIPAGQSRTMIAYRGVAKDGTLTASANDSIIDDLSFRLAYKLSYDANGGAKKSTSQIKASTDGKVKSIADKTSKVPVHDLEDTDVPGQYRDFILDTTKVKFSDVKFENGAWLNAPMPDSGDGATAMFPLKIGASATLPNVGEWTDDSGHTHSINAVISLHSWNGGSISQLWTHVEGELSTRKDLFWINTVGRNSDLPAQVIKALGGIDTSKRVGCQWTVNFTYEDGTPVPDTFRGVTGFNDLDGWDAQPDLKFEGVQLVSGFDGAYKTRDAELATYGVNGFAGAKHDSGPESNLDGKQQIKHRLAATWTGSSFTFGYDLQNHEGRDRGSRMTFGVPVTRTKVLTYDANGGTGQVPSRTETGRTETAASGTDGTVRLAADKSAGPESGTIADDRRVLTDTTARQDDGTSQRTITRSDGSVRVETIATTGAVSGCQVYYPAGAKITLATAKADSDCWDSSQISKTNRTFYGWSANTDANDKDVPVADTMDRATLDANAETQITMPARAKTVYALWAINPTLTYNVNAPATTKAPDAPASITVPYNTAADDKSGWTVGDTGKITGYSFDGWYTSPTGGDKYDWSTKLTNDVTMYAHWTANGYTVKYDAGGGKGTMGDQKFTFDVPQNLSPNAFTRDGYTFTGWKRADTGDAYQDGQQVANLTSTPNGIVTMIAQWTPNPASINYDPNPPTGRTPGGQGTANWTGHTGDTQAIGANGWTVDGYTFIGWNTSADGKGTAYAPGTTWIANGTLTLYAQWTPGQAGLTYDGNGATGGKTDPQPGKTDEKINVRDNGFTRDGYMFVTWNTQAGCKGKAVNPGDEWTLQGSSTLYACWAGTAQTLTYHGNGATGGNTAAQSGKTGDELTTNANGFTRDGYTFVRWDTAKDGSGTAYGEGKNGVSQYVMKPAGNDLYAIWKANPATIQYRNDWPNTTGSTPDTTGNTGDTVTISQNSFDRPGYTFTGWSTSKRGDPSLNPGDKHTLEPGTTTVWAQWKANPAHLVYNSNIGSIGSETKTVDGVVDQTVKTLGNPFDRPGYTFSGWNTQADGKGKAYDPGADYTLTANDKSTPKNTSVLYAQWKINGASLKFNPNGGIGHVDDVTVDAFSTVTIPGDAKEPKITRPGYRFVGWSTEKIPPAGSTFLQPGEGKVTLPAEGSTTVYAQWEPSLTTLPFTGGQAQVPTIWLYAGFALMLIALGVMMPMLRMRMAATKRTGKHMPITGGKHAK